ncbi:MAG: DNA cytosine methyltransferase [Patescibacteria group bacterium]|nr:DNA cytosine methyltransferase [Patescibacteria group bacterium]
MRWLDLFSGIGMYATGLEQAGHEIIGFCENDSWARKILKKHWPTKPISWSIELLNKALMASLGDSHAKTSAQPMSNQTELKEPDLPANVQDSSGRWLEPFAWYDHGTGSWRTWQRCFNEKGQMTWAKFLGPWHPAGMIANGIAWRRQPLAHPTIVPEHSFLPTILASESDGCSRKRFQGSPYSQNTRTAEAFRTSFDCPKYLNPSLAEELMGLPIGYTELETETLLASSEKSPKT